MQDGLRDAKVVANWIVNDLVGALAKDGKDWERCEVKKEEIGELVDLLGAGKLSGSFCVLALLKRTSQADSRARLGGSAKILLEHLVASPPSPSSRVPAILAAHSLLSVATDSLDSICAEVVAAHPDWVEAIRSGKKPGLMGSLVGQVMKRTKGRADGKAVGEKLKELISR